MKRHYSATNVEMNRVKHIECRSAPTEFTNRTVPERTMLGFRMAELDVSLTGMAHKKQKITDDFGPII